MFTNYFKTAWRNLVKGKMHSFINILGLSIGMAVTILIGLWISGEFIPGRVSNPGLVHMQDTAVLNYSLSIGYSLCIPPM